MPKIPIDLEEPNSKFTITPSFFLININCGFIWLRNKFRISCHASNGQKWWFSTELDLFSCQHHFKMLNISTNLEEPNFKSTVTQSFTLINISYHFLSLQNKFRIFCHIWNGESQYLKWSKMMIPDRLP